jgi:uncharacterized damage-inducible protein DinB
MFKTILDEAIEAWEDGRRGTIEEAENIPANRYDFRPTPEVRSVSGLLIHIMEVSLIMAGELTREDANLRRYPWPKLIAHYSKPIDGLTTKRELVAALRRTLKDGTAAIRKAGEIHFLQQILRYDGLKATRLAWFHHIIAHEYYHRGQLALCQRLMGIKPALTKRIEGG